MKLAILGGAGLRAPLFVHGLVKKRHDVHFDKVVLFDNDEERIALLGTLSTYLHQREGAEFELKFTADIREAVEGADFIFSAIRVGQDAGRVSDETIALRHGVIGQETTGPGGFAMALRTIPVMLEYAKVITELAPNAWVLNFTNPSGLISQALNDYSDLRVIGICDSPSGMVRRLGKYLGVPPGRVGLDYFGLNHLGWVRHVWIDGQDRLPHLLDAYEDLAAKDSEFGFFDPELVRSIGMLPNEYLYYFYYKQESVQNIRTSGQTRGEQIHALNTRLMAELRELVPSGQLDKAFEAYLATIGQRKVTYMSRETSGTLHKQHDREVTDVLMGGYEEMAMSVIRSITQGETSNLILNVPNGGAIAGFAGNDVVEVPCQVTQHGCTPLTIGEIPDVARAWMGPVKAYERLTVQAAVHGDYTAALGALTVHPLVPSFRSAKAMLDEYLAAHAACLPQFQ